MLGNVLWFIAWLIPNDQTANTTEEVASVDGEAITKEHGWLKWSRCMGKKYLLEMVNAQVMEAAAKKYDIKVSDQEIDLELALIRSTQDGSDTSFQSFDEK